MMYVIDGNLRQALLQNLEAQRLGDVIGLYEALRAAPPAEVTEKPEPAKPNGKDKTKQADTAA